MILLRYCFVTNYVKAIGTNVEIFDEEKHSESRLIIWEMKRLRSDKEQFRTVSEISLVSDWLNQRWCYGVAFLFLESSLRQKIVRLSSCDEITIDNYISSLEKLIAPSIVTKSHKPIKPQKIQVSGNFLRIDNQDFDLSNEALDNLRKSIAESILFLDRQSRDF